MNQPAVGGEKHLPGLETFFVAPSDVETPDK
jgi:hypothetical protein